MLEEFQFACCFLAVQMLRVRQLRDKRLGMRVEFRVEPSNEIRVHRSTLRFFVNEMGFELFCQFREHLPHFLEFLREFIPDVHAFLLRERTQLRAALRALAALTHRLTLHVSELLFNTVLQSIHVFHDIRCNATR